MEFKIYNEKNCRVTTREAAVRLTKGGVVILNAAAIKKMEFVIGNRIVFAQDVKQTKEWYISRDADGFEIKSKSGTTQSYGIQSSGLCNEILASLGLAAKSSYTFKLAGAATEVDGKAYWGLITSTVKA